MSDVAPLKILVVEDEAPKLEHIDRFLSQTGVNSSICFAHSVNAALDALDDVVPDLILLDMSLPTFDVNDREDGGRPQGFGGIEILRHISMSEIKCATIIITGYEAFPREGEGPVELSQLREELNTEFPSILKGVLHYNSTYDEWKTELVRVLRNVGVNSGDHE